MSNLFISYAREDDERFVEKLYRDLIAVHVDVWWDRETMQNRGRTFLQELRDAIDGSERMLAVIGPSALVSEYVQAEWRHASLFAKVVVPVLRVGGFDDVPGMVGLQHGVDFRASRPYPEAFSELKRILGERVVEPGPYLIPPPRLPPYYLARPADITRLREKVLADTVRPIVITSTKQVTALHGMGGVGKTATAIAFARSIELRRAMQDGIIWLKLRECPDLLELMKRVGQCLDDELSLYSGPDAAQQRLARLLETRTCLVILDDVWDIRHVTPFLNALGPRCRLLITTRDRGLVTAAGATEHRIELLDSHASLSLLSDWSCQAPEALPASAHAVADECGNLPLALAMCGAMVRDGHAWDDLLHALREFDLAYLSKRFPNYDHPSVLRSMAVSIRALEGEQKELATCYLELAVFAQAESIPEAAASTLWRHACGISEAEVRRRLVALEGKALLQLEGTFPKGLIRLHDLQRDYLLFVRQDLARFHETLLHAYRGQCGDDWSTGPVDGYFFENLALHLDAAGRKAELAELLVDARWLRAKLAATSVSRLAADYDRVCDDPALCLVQRAIQLAANVIAIDSRQLGSQLLGRMHDQTQSGIRKLLSSIAATEPGEWLRPLNLGLMPPGGPLLSTISRHQSYVTCVAYSPDERFMVSGSADATVRVWDPETGIQVRLMSGHSGWVRDLVVLPDGEVLVSVGDDCTIRFWCIRSGEQIDCLTGHAGNIRSVAVTSDGNTLVTACDDQRLLVWDVLTRSVVREMVGHGGEVASVVILSDDRRAVSAASDQTIRIWDLAQGKEIRSIRIPGTSGFALAVSPDDRLVAADSGDCNIGVWNLQTGVSVRELRGHRSYVNAVAFLGDGATLVSASEDKTLRLWNVHSGEQLDCLAGHSGWITDVAVTSDGRRAVSAGRDETIKLWDLGRVLPRVDPDWHSARVVNVLMLGDGLRAASADAEGIIKTWDLATGKPLRDLKAHTRSVNSLAATSDGGYVVSGGDDGAVRCWDLRLGKLRWEQQDADRIVWKVVISPDERRVASADSKGDIKVWCLRRGRLLTTLTGHTDSVWDLACLPSSNRLFSVSEDGTIKAWDLRRGKLVGNITALGEKPCAIRPFPSGQKLMLASVDGVPLIFNLKGGGIERLGDQSLRTTVVPEIVDDRYALMPTSDSSIMVWDLDRQCEVRRFVGHKKLVAAISFFATTRRAISAGQDGAIRVWDFETGACVASFTGESFFCSLAVRQDGLIVVGEHGGQVQILQLETPGKCS